MSDSAGLPRFEFRRFTLAKDADAPQQNQDAAVVNEATRTAAIADGVSAGIFCGPWARLLVDAVVDVPPAVDDREAFSAWMAARRAEWQSSIDVSRLAWFQKAKLPEGAFATLLWLRVEPADAAAPPESPAAVRAWAIGDSCLLHVRQGKPIGKFPVAAAADFGNAPLGLGSVDRNRDELIAFHRYEAPAADGDLLVLCTDALAEYLLCCDESGEAIDWPGYWDASEDEWRQRVVALREAQQLRYDDTTVLMIRLREERKPAPAAEGASETPAESASEAVEASSTPRAIPSDAPPAEANGDGDPKK